MDEDKYQSFQQVDAIVLGGRSQAYQSTQYNKFTISYQYFKKEVVDKFDFLHADIHQTFLQVDAINSGVHGQSYRKNSEY